MSSFAEKIVKAYPEPQFVIPTTKDDVLRLIDRLKSTIVSLDDFSEFPEGSRGVVVYAILKAASDNCPDIGDFGYIHQGLEMVLKASFEEICASFGS